MTFTLAYGFFFLMWTVSKIFIDFVTILLLFKVCLGFFTRGVWDLGSLTRDGTAFQALEGTVLTTGPPGKSLFSFLYIYYF